MNSLPQNPWTKPTPDGKYVFVCPECNATGDRYFALVKPPYGKTTDRRFFGSFDSPMCAVRYLTLTSLSEDMKARVRDATWEYYYGQPFSNFAPGTLSNPPFTRKSYDLLKKQKSSDIKEMAAIKGDKTPVLFSHHIRTEKVNGLKAVSSQAELARIFSSVADEKGTFTGVVVGTNIVLNNKKVPSKKANTLARSFLYPKTKKGTKTRRFTGDFRTLQLDPAFRGPAPKKAAPKKKTPKPTTTKKTRKPKGGIKVIKPTATAVTPSDITPMELTDEVAGARTAAERRVQDMKTRALEARQAIATV